ncbi:MAG: hypothetical protein WBS33_03375 [Verrucomicrobiia bacterium]
MRLKTNATFFFLCALFVTASTARAQVYEFQFITSASGFGGDLFFNAPSGSGPAGEVLYGDSFITTPDGTFTGSESIPGGPIVNPPPAIVWSPGGITALNLNLYESLNSQMYNWTATPTSIADSPVAGIPLDPSASGTWEYVGAVPEPGAMLLTALGVAATLIWPIRHNSLIRRTRIN